jgi:hypothetical protein
MNSSSCRQSIEEALDMARERFDQLSSQVAETYAEVTAEQGMAEIDAAIARQRHGS